MTTPDPTARPSSGITGDFSRLYDVFVDWPGRLGREIPGIERHLASVGARRVLDAGCGTGQHVRALRERGFVVHGADVSEDMLDQAARLLGGRDGLHVWRMGEPAPDSLRAAAPFDALIAMGNVWPQLAREASGRAAAATFQELVRPGGLVLLGFKAVAVRKQSGNPYMPLMRREHEGRPLWFVRFVDLDLPPFEDGTPAAEFHRVVVAGDASQGAGEREALVHDVARTRAWAPDELGSWFAARGFVDVRVSGKLLDPASTPTGEDVFVSMNVAG